jgi:acetylornithine deacetylase/succinyl-diaminopimelate desuccinylase-like protein
MSLDPLELLQQLIRIPSVNPMGRDTSGPDVGEGRLTDFLQSRCEQLGLRWLRQNVHPGRDNLIALLSGEPPALKGGEFLLWDVHQDTVPADGMTVDPFGGEIRDGRVYGRGACDVKGSMAAILAAISRTLSGPKQSNRPNIAVALTVNEECGFSGSRALSALWQRSAEVSGAVVAGTCSIAELFPRAPDAAIVAEPTGFNIVTAHNGVVRWRCHAVGRAAHTSRPDAGVNAIYGMAEIVSSIQQYHQQLQLDGPLHALCGRPSVCVSTIHGGVAVNTVPERTTIDIDRRVGPEENPAEAYGELCRYMAKHANVGQCRVEHEPPFMESRGLTDRGSESLAKSLASLVRDHSRDPRIVGAPYATDAAAIAEAGIPSVVFGPGSIDQAHTADEFISIDELQFATDVFQRIATEGLLSRTC